MIKILTGWGNPGGSTVAHINLCNAFNERGIECKLYSPHQYHFDKCSSDSIQNLQITPEDHVIGHFLNLLKLNCKKMIYSCHESNLDPLFNKDLSMYSRVHYVSKWQQQFHNIKKSYFILPNILEDLKRNDKPNKKIGGVIGSVDYNKQTHLSIIKALDDGCEIVYLFGNITDKPYYKNFVEPLLNDRVKLFGHIDDKQKMYDMVTDVYQSSIRETWGFVAGECLLTDTKYHCYGMCNFDFNNVLSNDKIIETWVKELKI